MKKIKSIFVLLLPIIIIFQPLFLNIAGSVILYLRAIGIPLVLAIIYFKRINSIGLLIILFILLANSYFGLNYYPKDFFIQLLVILSSVVMFRVGYESNKISNNILWVLMPYGISLFNLVTLVTLVALSLGLINLMTIYEAFQRNIEYGLSRFSYGNPIEIPFLVTTFLYAALKNSDKNKNYIYLAIINLTVVLISESRLIAIIAFLVVISEALKGSFVNFFRIILCIILLGLMLDIDTYFSGIFTSLLDRFQGNDEGSYSDRLSLYKLVFESIGLHGFLFGHGLTSSSGLMMHEEGRYRTVESIFLQLFYETGILGLFLILWTVFYGINFKTLFFNPILIIIWIQTLFLLPFMGFSPLLFFALGSLHGPRFNKA